MEKKDNQYEILKSALRLLLFLIIGAAFSFLAIYLLFKDNDDIIKLLFSKNSNAQVITLVLVLWFFGTIVGAIITAIPFISVLVEKNEQLKDVKEMNKTLRKLLGKIDKKYAKSPSVRMFDEIGDIGCSTSNNIPDDDFTTLQEQLKAKSPSK